MPVKRTIAVVLPVLRFVAWTFSDLAPGVDLFLGCLAGAWFALMLGRPDIFDRHAFAGMGWMPDGAWLAFMGAVAGLHFAGLVRLRFIALRVSAALASAWFWALISISLARAELAPGVFSYALVSAMALSASIYISGRARIG